MTYLNPGQRVEEDKPCIQATPLKPCNWLPEASTITLKSQPNGNNRDQQRTEVWLKERAEALSRAWMEELERNFK